jgi:hypothetical protein
MMLFMAFTWANASRAVWPPVNDPATLLKECAAILGHPGRVQEPNWPASVRSLKPVRVRVHQDCVIITISTGGIGAAYGYLVYPDARKYRTTSSGPVADGLVSPGLFKYEADE